MKIFKDFKHIYEIPQGGVKIKIYVNFYCVSGIEAVKVNNLVMKPFI